MSRRITQGKDRLSNVDNLLRGTAADRAITHQVRVDVTTPSALDRMSLEIFTDEQGLNLSQFKRAQDAP